MFVLAVEAYVDAGIFLRARLIENPPLWLTTLRILCELTTQIRLIV